MAAVQNPTVASGWPAGATDVPVPAAPAVPAGAYPDPWDPGRLRWWDGRAWTAATQPLPPVAARDRLAAPARLVGPGSIAAFAATGVLALLAVLVSVGPGPFVVASLVAVAPLPLYAWAALSLDRFHPEPRSYLLWTFLAGATAVVLWAVVVNTGVGVVVAAFVGVELADTATAVVVAPVVEEAGKAVVLLLLYRRVRHQINGPLDGVVYATMVGLGFATVENVLYYGASIADGSLPAVFVLRGVVSPFAHPVFTAATGIGFGLLAAGRTRLGSGAPVLGLVVAMVLHALWNGSASFGGYGLLLVFFGLMVPVFVGLVVLCRVEGRRERRTFPRHLAREVAAGVLTDADVRVLGDLRARRRLVQAARRLHPQAGVAAHELAADLVELAATRERVARGAFSERYGPPEAAERELEARIARARWALPPAPAGAPWSGLSGALGLPLPR